jgi:hypothetical protein
MYTLQTFLLLALPLAGLAGPASQFYSGYRRDNNDTSPCDDSTPDNSTSDNGTSDNSTSDFQLLDLYQGQNFFDGWQFDSFPDPTHGLVNFLGQGDAFNQGLAYVQEDNTTVLAVDDFTDINVGDNRNSVRISTTKTYNGGLFIADFFAMPHGCSVWPAWWSVGPNWPMGGEIDVVEGVNNQATNQMTLHTSDGCTLDNQISSNSGNSSLPGNIAVVAATGNVLSTQCASSDTSNNGCAFDDPNSTSHGKGFNLIAGGVFAHLWTATSIKIWHFQRGQIPEDITNMQPNPDTWPTPAAVFADNSCDIKSHFKDHQLVIDTTLCGDFAGSQYPNSGCPGTCAEAVANASNFRFAKWKINYIAVYNSSATVIDN